jgi:multiple sugar transport system permease protein
MTNLVHATTARLPRRKLRGGRRRWLDWMALPALIVLAVVIGYPMVRAVILSFYDYNLIGGAQEAVGAHNYSLIGHDSIFWQALLNTAVYTGASVVGGGLIGLILALATENLKGPWRGLRALMLTPWAVPIIVVAFLFRFMFDERGGIINALLIRSSVIHDAVPWLSSSQWAMFSVVVANVWSQAPFFLLLFTAALAAVPNEVIEAARIDHARTWSMIVHIKLPYLRGAALVGGLIMVIQNFNNFPLIWSMTEGGPGYSTTTLLIYVYRLAFTKYHLGYASAVGVIWLVVLIMLSAFFLRAMRKEATT